MPQKAQMLTFVGRKWAESFLPCGREPQAEVGLSDSRRGLESQAMCHVKLKLEAKGVSDAQL